ncbi:hypothetical protein HCBG_05105 [Histoplasma capsulatum G186AR]|uniref:Uncharacterized protein n=1 Tax=Ajellomyces capsulatus (strain G186AR / H82 / ATCC MYA-2454 / RMSCC 2432) TaxID=447093 RepID=C0NPM5_AJECG|nr:uncharacterized protein HCBG_05105 [Histoplasma capsulatum G186AR]EEH06885.1 hypothetical protein HCBG_05105 [Histoplasma capsulatum G186AR]
MGGGKQNLYLHLRRWACYIFKGLRQLPDGLNTSSQRWLLVSAYYGKVAEVVETAIRHRQA